MSAPPPPLLAATPPRFRARPPPPPPPTNPPHAFRHLGPRGPWNQAPAPPPPPPPPMHPPGNAKPSNNPLGPPFEGPQQPPLQGPPAPTVSQLSQRERMGEPFPGRSMPNQEFISGNVSYLLSRSLPPPPFEKEEKKKAKGKKRMCFVGRPFQFIIYLPLK